MLHRSANALVLALFYAALMLPSWIITCILTSRPIPTDSYDSISGYHRTWPGPKQYSLYLQNERWYHAARVLQSIASVLVLPLTSAVCASAAVIYMQRGGDLTLRQTMALADRSWMDLWTGLKLLPLFQTDTWKRQGSSFLRLALVVSLLGLIVFPLQAIFLSTTTVKALTQMHRAPDLVDLVDSWGGTADSYNSIMAVTRAALTTATTTERHASLWSCGRGLDPFDTPCERQGATLDNISALADPFLAELPSGFNTGLIRQFLPRINSSARFEEVTPDEFPAGCAERPDAFYANYANASYPYGGDARYFWGLEACMPANVTQSSWKATRDRQDFSEVLYLNVTLDRYRPYLKTQSFYRLTVDTTAGYFELPNYMNGGLPGPLLASNPGPLCGDDCEYQGLPSSNKNRRDAAIATPPAGELEVVPGKGPLFTIAMALFGPSSFINTRSQHPEAYETFTRHRGSPRPNAGACIDLLPLIRLLHPGHTDCITNYDQRTDASSALYLIVDWLAEFVAVDPRRLSSAFSAAAFLANKARLDHDFTRWPRFDVHYDMGADTQIPTISPAAMIVVSVLMGLHLAMLLALALYAAWSPRWTGQLDAFALLRIGAAVAERLPLRVAHETEKVDVLDAIPGSMGDRAEGQVVGVLGLGAPVRLRAKRKFSAYQPRCT
ncbi:hypothetical protein BJX61DRAFT_551929 [Aspergillus egyptiacus]|nr:hypothetical protein BJX61DRAFT_551929 [Aspergillus egyptiacus]